MPLELLVSIDRPFQGLRPFEPDQSLLFFGREQHTEELLHRLSANRFLAVVGTSGSGKSSLVRAGLLPALYRGYLVGSTTHWRIALMKPGGAPVKNLAAALAGEGALGPGEGRLETLRSSSLGLVEVVGEANLAPGESLLIVADQFEELFRYAKDDQAADEAALFVSLLLQAAEQFDLPVYVVLTMRSDFLGDCAQFTGLPEALSRSQYLIPRLTREQRQQAIERPLQLAGAAIAPSLVQQLLNDSADDARALGGQELARGGRPDPLPVLQHTLMKTFDEWKRQGGAGPLELSHYRLVGGVEKALDQHAEKIFGDLPPARQVWAEKIFRCLTTTESGRQIRRPTKREQLYEIVGTASEGEQREVDATLQPFLERDESLLIESEDHVLDIPHESLIWKWLRLQEWVRAEAGSAEWYVRLVSDAKNQSGLWRDPDLQLALVLSKTEGWNEAWAAQYSASSFAGAESFLVRSRKQQSRERWTWRLALGVILVALAASIFFLRQGQQEKAMRQQAEVMRQTAEKNASDSQNKQKAATDKLNNLAQDLATKEELLKGSLTPAERKKVEQEARDLKENVKKAEQSQSVAILRAANAEKIAAAGGDLTKLNQSLQTSVNELTSSNKTFEKKLGDEQSSNRTLQDALNKANAEIARLKPATTRPLPDSVPSEPPNIVAKDPVSTPPACKGDMNPLDGLCYLRLPAGRFTMGCSPGDIFCSDDEKPAHPVEITKSFWMGETEVTQPAYQRVMKANPSGFRGANLPVEQVDWSEAARYCQAVGLRLPTEAEWEYAARAGSTESLYGPLVQVAWLYGNSNSKTHPVGTKLPNAWGLYDMLGNVSEWNADWYDPKYYGQRVVKDPKGPAVSIEEVRPVRGGGWYSSLRGVRASDRHFSQPTLRLNFIGFRCAGELR